MFEAFKVSLTQWNQRTNDRQKLQHAYLVLLMVVVFVAGLISLFNANGSRQVMYLAIALIIAFVANVLVWSVLKTTLLDRLPRQPARRR